MYFKAAWNIKRMRGRVMADRSFISELQVDLRLPATAAVLLKHFNTQMPTLPST